MSFVKVTKTHTDFQIAATQNDIELFQLPAGAILETVKQKHSVAFGGGTITAYTLAVGIAASLEKYQSPFDVFQAVGDSVIAVSGGKFCENQAAAVSVRAKANSTGANLSASTAGTVDFWIFYSPAV